MPNCSFLTRVSHVVSTRHYPLCIIHTCVVVLTEAIALYQKQHEAHFLLLAASDEKDAIDMEAKHSCSEHVSDSGRIRPMLPLHPLLAVPCEAIVDAEIIESIETHLKPLYSS